MPCSVIPKGIMGFIQQPQGSRAYWRPCIEMQPHLRIKTEEIEKESIISRSANIISKPSARYKQLNRHRIWTHNLLAVLNAAPPRCQKACEVTRITRVIGPSWLLKIVCDRWHLTSISIGHFLHKEFQHYHCVIAEAGVSQMFRDESQSSVWEERWRSPALVEDEALKCCSELNAAIPDDTQQLCSL